jgi:hypothetical protein
VCLILTKIHHVYEWGKEERKKGRKEERKKGRM